MNLHKMMVALARHERLSDGEVIEYLADAETGCQHCAEAFDLILQREHDGLDGTGYNHHRQQRSVQA